MKSLKINYIHSLDMASVTEAVQILSKFESEYEKVDTLNWPLLFDYKPETNFKIARSADSLFILYKVKNDHIRAIYKDDQSAVFEDSCVEFFCKHSEQPVYRNFEFNCIGTCRAFVREGRDEKVQALSPFELSKIGRYSSLGNEPILNRLQNKEWSICVKIPFELLNIDAEALPEKIMGNFYKCGDKTEVPHYVSWNPIKTEKPDFHRPEYFGEIYL